MQGLIKRPPPVFDASRGLLHNEHFQIAYVTSDIAEAEAVFRRRFGVTSLRETEIDMPGGAHLSIRAVWIGGILYEIISGSGPGMELYTSYCAPEGFTLRLHHQGFLVPDEDSWAALQREVARGGWTVRSLSDTPGHVRAMHVAAEELGHLLEFVFPSPAFLKVLEGTPVA